MPGRGTNVSIAPSAIVEWGAGATIGDDTRVDHHAVIRRNAVIGARCMIGVGAYIDGGTVIGDGCRVQNGAQIMHGVELHNGVTIGPHVVFTNAPVVRAFMPPTHGEPTVVEEGASIGANSTVLCGVRIGKYAVIRAGSVVTRDVGAHGVVHNGEDDAWHFACVCGAALLIAWEEALACKRCSRMFTVALVDGSITVSPYTPPVVE